jgi:hypothetical protein
MAAAVKPMSGAGGQAVTCAVYKYTRFMSVSTMLRRARADLYVRGTV